MSLPSRRGRALAATVLAATVATGCGTHVAAVPARASSAESLDPSSARALAPIVVLDSSVDPPSPRPTPRHTPTAPARTSSPPARARSVTRHEVRGVVSTAGVRQWVDCRGNGPVTVVVVPGLGATAASWSQVYPALTRVTRTCVYDRPGLGLSPARPEATQVLDAGIYAHELHALLLAVGEPGPYVVVGHSFGGLIARAFVRDYTWAVAGVMLAESVAPYDPTNGAFWAEAGHQISMAASSAATGAGPDMGHLPLLVLSASDPEEDHLGGPTYGQPQWAIDLWRAQQAADVRLSTDSIHVIAHSGHVLQQDNPGAVIAADTVLVTAAETGARLRCSSLWEDHDATCS